ncbi:branched-chain amino acid transport system permease protein [Thermocatellispora tengchongensis]|uniref:Branched-chain amino acid transport system permease protein n=1 Tax=Thermocatellispora tengchongensis TaxID=1073253 RepID=A0A840PJS2_9ACTN|nr:branched-chain amino acid ABC transporter permease [Thermocatellispora tengchongensis]MBB5139778.1 branched-chain amino acid transport system permease protein [Thermocatellispora tengchongensis]
MTTVWAGLATGAIYSLVAIGYNVVLLASGTFNFAHAQLLMAGTFLAYTGAVTLGLPVLPTLLLGAAGVAVVALLEERIAIRPLLGRSDAHGALITTVGAATILDGLAAVIWGREPLTVPSVLPDEPLTLLGGTVRPVDLALIALTLLTGVGLHLWSRHSLLGLASLASAEDREAAAARGINVRLLGTGAFVLAGAIAGVFGLLVGARTYAVFDLGHSLALFGFVAIAIGGSGSQLGGLIGGFATGLVYAFAARYIGAEFPQIVVFGVFLLILFLRPRGLFGAALERRV